MKQYTFYVFLLMLFFNKVIFCNVTDIYSVVLFDKNDVAKYWLVKQLSEKHNKDVFNSAINPLITALKKPIEMSQNEYCEVKDITKKCIQKEYCNEWIYFCFNSRTKPKIIDFSIMSLPTPFLPYSEDIRPKYRSDLNTNRSYRSNSYIGRNDEEELAKNITKILTDLIKEKLENSVSQTKTWPSWVDPDDID